MTQTRKANRERVRRAQRTDLEEPWNVILHNDRAPINRVVWRLHRTILDTTFNKKGQAVAKTCHKELAELYEERLSTKGLTVSIEPGSRIVSGRAKPVRRLRVRGRVVAAGGLRTTSIRQTASV